MNNRPRLLTVIDPRTSKLDVSAANIYGEVVPIPGLDDSPFKTDDMVRIVDQFVEDMNFNPEVDAIIMTGNLIVVSVAFGYLLARYGFVRALLFDATKYTYSLRRVSMPKDMLDEPETLTEERSHE